MTIAITHDVSDRLAECELTHLDRKIIDLENARKQLEQYRNLLQSLGVDVVSLQVNREYPDSVFIEDAAIVLPELAIQCSIGAKSRQQEPDAIAAYLAAFKTVAKLPDDATLDGGDVLVFDKNILVGRSGRTNEAGFQTLQKLVSPFGYRTQSIEVKGALHLKTAICALDHNRLLVNPAWISERSLEGFELVAIPSDERFGANILRLESCIVVADEHPKTAALIRSLGFQVEATPISEFQKAEGGLTCLSLIF